MSSTFANMDPLSSDIENDSDAVEHLNNLPFYLQPIRERKTPPVDPKQKNRYLAIPKGVYRNISNIAIEHTYPDTSHYMGDLPKLSPIKPSKPYIIKGAAEASVEERKGCKQITIWFHHNPKLPTPGDGEFHVVILGNSISVKKTFEKNKREFKFSHFDKLPVNDCALYWKIVGDINACDKPDIWIPYNAIEQAVSKTSNDSSRSFSVVMTRLDRSGPAYSKMAKLKEVYAMQEEKFRHDQRMKETVTTANVSFDHDSDDSMDDAPTNAQAWLPY